MRLWFYTLCCLVKKDNKYVNKFLLSFTKTFANSKKLFRNRQGNMRLAASWMIFQDHRRVPESVFRGQNRRFKASEGKEFFELSL